MDKITKINNLIQNIDDLEKHLILIFEFLKIFLKNEKTRTRTMDKKKYLKLYNSEYYQSKKKYTNKLKIYQTICENSIKQVRFNYDKNNLTLEI